MMTKIGIDIARQKRFLDSLKKGKEPFLNRIFTPQELRQNSDLQLASIFSIKESVIKALELNYDSWLQISTDRKENGKVNCSLIEAELAKNIISLDTSVSHDGGWIIAVTVAVSK